MAITASDLETLLPASGSYEIEYHPDRTLKRLARFEHRECVAVLELSRGEVGEFRSGIAGEQYRRGFIQPIGPFAGSVAGSESGISFDEWARRKIEAIQKLTADRPG